MGILGKYNNGNYNVQIFSDGTKIRENDEKFFSPIFPESIDIKITDYCEMGCGYCHENSTTKGIHGDILDSSFIETLQPFTELAIGGGNPLSHPQLIPFLENLRDRKIIANLTVHQKHFIQNKDLLKGLSDSNLIYGLGISFSKPDESLVGLTKEFNNIVFHVINGIIKLDDLKSISYNGSKVLILGYKKFRRGEQYFSPQIEENMKVLNDNLMWVFSNFKIVSFDNLALKQFNIKKKVSRRKWDEFYMGDDGGFTMYIDLVKKTFAKTSTSFDRFPVKNNIIEMFEVIKNG